MTSEQKRGDRPVLVPDKDFQYQRAFIYTIGPCLLLLIFLGGLRVFDLWDAPASYSTMTTAIIAVTFVSYCWINRIELIKRGKASLKKKEP